MDGSLARSVDGTDAWCGSPSTQRPATCTCTARTARQSWSWILREARALSAGAHDTLGGCAWTPAFLFCPEVTAHGTKAASALPPPRVRGPDPGGLVPSAQAQWSAQVSRGRGMAAVVLAENLDGWPPARSAPAGTLLPGVCGAGHPDPGHRRGPHPGPQGGLGAVHRPVEPAKPLPLLPQPENHDGTGQKTAEFLSGFFREATPALRHVPGCADRRGRGVPWPSPHPKKVFEGSRADREPSRLWEIVPHGVPGEGRWRWCRRQWRTARIWPSTWPRRSWRPGVRQRRRSCPSGRRRSWKSRGSSPAAGRPTPTGTKS